MPKLSVDLVTYLLRNRRVSDSGCWEWTRGKSLCGYGRVQFNQRKWPVHRLSWTLLKAPITKGRYILHRCDNPLCFNPAHLFEGTQLDNMRDMMAKGRGNRANSPKGEAHGGSKLTTAQVVEIRESLDIGADLARQFNVSPSLIGLIRNGRIWKHVEASS
jgi:hypothetical protein